MHASSKASQEQRQFKSCCYGIDVQRERLVLPATARTPPGSQLQPHTPWRWRSTRKYFWITTQWLLHLFTLISTRWVKHFWRPLHHYSRPSPFPSIYHSTSWLCNVPSCRNRKLTCLVNFQEQGHSFLTPYTGIYVIFAACSTYPWL